MILGVIAYFVLRSRNPEALDRVNDVYGGDTAATEVDGARPERTTY